MRFGSYLAIVLLLPWLQDRPPIPIPAQPARPALRMEPVAETKLLMQGINLPNFEGIEKLLKEKPGDDDAWKFMRGQALLIAENGNLLMLRPPHNAGEAAWLEKAAALRASAAKLAGVVAQRDYVRSRAGLIDLAGACNDCHAGFRVATRILPFKDEGARPKTSKSRPGVP